MEEEEHSAFLDAIERHQPVQVLTDLVRRKLRYLRYDEEKRTSLLRAMVEQLVATARPYQQNVKRSLEMMDCERTASAEEIEECSNSLQTSAYGLAVLLRSLAVVFTVLTSENYSSEMRREWLSLMLPLLKPTPHAFQAALPSSAPPMHQWRNPELSVLAGAVSLTVHLLTHAEEQERFLCLIATGGAGPSRSEGGAEDVRAQAFDACVELLNTHPKHLGSMYDDTNQSGGHGVHREDLSLHFELLRQEIEFLKIAILLGPARIRGSSTLMLSGLIACSAAPLKHAARPRVGSSAAVHTGSQPLLLELLAAIELLCVRGLQTAVADEECAKLLTERWPRPRISPGEVWFDALPSTVLKSLVTDCAALLSRNEYTENAKVLLALLCGLSIRCSDDDAPGVAKKCISRLMAQLDKESTTADADQINKTCFALSCAMLLCTHMPDQAALHGRRLYAMLFTFKKDEDVTLDSGDWRYLVHSVVHVLGIHFFTVAERHFHHFFGTNSDSLAPVEYLCQLARIHVQHSGDAPEECSFGVREQVLMTLVPVVVNALWDVLIDEERPCKEKAIALSGFERLASSPLSDEKNWRVHEHFRRPLEWCIGALQHVTSVDIAVAALGAANPIVIMIASGEGGAESAEILGEYYRVLRELLDMEFGDIAARGELTASESDECSDEEDVDVVPEFLMEAIVCFQELLRHSNPYGDASAWIRALDTKVSGCDTVDDEDQYMKLASIDALALIGAKWSLSGEERELFLVTMERSLKAAIDDYDDLEVIVTLKAVLTALKSFTEAHASSSTSWTRTEQELARRMWEMVNSLDINEDDEEEEEDAMEEEDDDDEESYDRASTLLATVGEQLKRLFDASVGFR